MCVGAEPEIMASWENVAEEEATKSNDGHELFVLLFEKSLQHKTFCCCGIGQCHLLLKEYWESHKFSKNPTSYLEKAGF